MLSKPALDHEDAVQIVQAARDEALRQQWPVSIAVCDDGGHLLAFVRLDGANLASTRISQAKARTATLMKRDTVLVEDMIKNGRNAFLSAPDLDGMLEGGVAIVVEGHCVGAVGVSGVKAPEDAQVAHAGVSAWQAGLTP